MVANIIRLWFSYMLMLAVMTYNVGILLAAVLGLTLGYFTLGFGETMLDITSDGRMARSLVQQD